MRVLVLAPHPDDEAIGLGGAILQHTRAGDVVQTIMITSGELGDPDNPPEAVAQQRELEAQAASRVLGTAPPIFWRFPDGELQDRTVDLLSHLINAVLDFRPDRLYAPHAGEAHPDHHAAGMLAAYFLERSIHQPAVWTYEVWTPMAQPNEVESISPFIRDKIRAIRAHASQEERNGFVRAAVGLAAYRAEMHGRRHQFAEVFRRLT